MVGSTLGYLLRSVLGGPDEVTLARVGIKFGIVVAIMLG